MIIKYQTPKNIEAIYNKILIGLVVTIFLTIGYMYVNNAIQPDNSELAGTPLMGWSSRKRLLTKSIGDQWRNQDEEEFSTSEKIIKNVADTLHKDGYSAAGYKYVIIDESWSSPERSKNGELRPDNKLFPNGIHNLAKHIHKLDLKLGISGDIGTETCQGHPGSWGNYDRDAKTLSEWEIDLLKVGGCFANATMLEEGYRKFGEALKKTARPIIYAIDWPLHDRHVNFSEVVQISNLWRVYHDIHDSFESVMSVIDFVSANPNIFQKYSGPGSWADLDVDDIRDYESRYPSEYQVLQHYQRGCGLTRYRLFMDCKNIKFSTDPVREIPKCKFELKSEIVSSNAEFNNFWQRQPVGYEWEIYNMMEQEAQEYNGVETSYWKWVKAEIDYLTAVNNNCYQKQELPNPKRLKSSHF